MASSVCVLSMSLLLLVCGTVLHQTSAENLPRLREAIQLHGGFYQNYEQSQNNHNFSYLIGIYATRDIPALNEYRPILFVESINGVRSRVCIIFVDDDGSTAFHSIIGVTVPLRTNDTLTQLEQALQGMTRDKLEEKPLCWGNIKWTDYLVELTHIMTCNTPEGPVEYVLTIREGNATAIIIKGTGPEANAGDPYILQRDDKRGQLSVIPASWTFRR